MRNSRARLVTPERANTESEERCGYIAERVAELSRNAQYSPSSPRLAAKRKLFPSTANLRSGERSYKEIHREKKTLQKGGKDKATFGDRLSRNIKSGPPQQHQNITTSDTTVQNLLHELKNKFSEKEKVVRSIQRWK